MRNLLACATAVYIAATAVACASSGTNPVAKAHETAQTDKCSHEALAEATAICVARIKAECARGDKTCPVYVECQAGLDAWRECE